MADPHGVGVAATRGPCRTGRRRQIWRFTPRRWDRPFPSLLPDTNRDQLPHAAMLMLIKHMGIDTAARDCCQSGEVDVVLVIER